MLGITTTNARVGGFRGGIDADAKAIYNRIIAIPNGFSNLSRLNYFVKGLKAIYGSLSNVPVCYDAHWIGGVLGGGVGATAGQACARLCSLTVAGDAIQATASAQPLLLMHGGAASDNYWYGSGVSGNYCSTPNAAANRISGDIEFIAKFDYKTNSTYQFIVSTYDTGGYSLAIAGSTNLIYFEAKVGASVFGVTSTQNFPTTFNGYLKVTRTTSDGIVKFFTSNDGITYTQLGANAATTAGNLVTGTAPLKIGENFNTNYPFQGKIYRATISNSIGGAPVVDFNPATYNASTSQTAWTSSTGEVWTINTGTATTGYKGVICDRIIVMSDGVDDWIANSTVLRGDICTQYLSLKYYHTPNAGVAMVSAYDLASYNSIALLSATGIRCYQENGANVLNASVIYGTLNLISLVNKGGANSLQINNGTAVTNSQNPSTSKTGLVLFRNAFNGGFQAGFINTYIDSGVEDNSTTKTAMYNLIRSLNNNAF